MSDPSRRPTPRRDEIVAIATRLFAEHGFGRVSTRMIATASGVSQPTLYSHFADRQALLEEICIGWFEDLHDRLTHAIDDAGDGRGPLESLCRAYVELAWAEPDRYFIAFVAPDLHAERPPGPRYRQCGARAFGVLKQCVGAIPGLADPEAAAQSVWAALHGLATLTLWRAEFGWVDAERLLDAHVRLIAGGLAAPVGEGAQSR